MKKQQQAALDRALRVFHGFGKLDRATTLEARSIIDRSLNRKKISMRELKDWKKKADRILLERTTQGE